MNRLFSYILIQSLLYLYIISFLGLLITRTVACSISVTTDQEQVKHLAQNGTTYSCYNTIGDTEYKAKGRLPLPVPSIVYTTDTEMSSGTSDLDQPLKDDLPALTEISFRPRSLRSCAFTVVVRDSYDRNSVLLAQLT